MNRAGEELGRQRSTSWPPRCASCDTQLGAHDGGGWDELNKLVYCARCWPDDQVAPAQPADLTRIVDVAEETPAPAKLAGAVERRHRTREDQIREQHPRLAKLILALSDDPTGSRARSGDSVRSLYDRLDALCPSVFTLHERRIPGARMALDHLAVSSAGVHVIDTQLHRARVEARWLRRDGHRVRRLYVGGRDRTKLVRDVEQRVAAIKELLEAEGARFVPVHGIVCFLEAEWPLFRRSHEVDGVLVTRPRRLKKHLVGGGRLAGEPEQIAGLLHDLLPPVGTSQH